MKLLYHPNSKLREVAEPIDEFTPEIMVDLAQMFKLMLRYGGAGLAAPQVGINKRLIIVATPTWKCMLANPEITSFQGQQIDDEACLSIPKVKVLVHRAQEITVRGKNEQNKFVEISARGFVARVLQHEIDHLEGKLIIDYSKKFGGAKRGHKKKKKAKQG